MGWGGPQKSGILVTSHRSPLLSLTLGGVWEGICSCFIDKGAFPLAHTASHIVTSEAIPAVPLVTSWLLGCGAHAPCRRAVQERGGQRAHTAVPLPVCLGLCPACPSFLGLSSAGETLPALQPRAVGGCSWA